MLKRRDLRGLSTVVATLLIILLVLVAIGIVWVVMKNIISNQSEVAEKQKEFFLEGIRIADIRVNNGLVNISLERVGGKANVKVTGLQNITREEVMPLDIISLIDLSTSMLLCTGLNSSCCTTSLRGTYGTYGPTQGSLTFCSDVTWDKGDNCTSLCKGTWDNKLLSVQEANRELMNILFESPGTRIGFVPYNTTVVNSQSIDLTDNLARLNNTINSWQEATGNTCICCAINEAVKKLQQQSSDNRKKEIIVMSDGAANEKCIEQNTGDPIQDAIKASCDAEKELNNLTIYSVGVGGDVDNGTLIAIANCGGGKYFSAVNISDLMGVYTVLGHDIKASSVSISTFSYLYLVFYNGTSSYREKISDIPDVVQIKEYEFNVRTNLAGNITKIELYPVISYSGKEIIGPLFDKWELK